MLTNTIMDRKCYALRLSNLPSRLQPTLKLSSRQAHAQSRLRVRSTAASDDEPPTVGDWRSFRSQLMRTDAEATDNSRQTPENLALLRAQNKYLASEGLWASPSVDIRAGQLLLATAEAPELSGDPRVTQLVVLILHHDSRGTEGIMLNRPSFACVQDLMGWGWETVAPENLMISAFKDSVVYLGGWYAPNKIARQRQLFLHGQADLPGSVEVSPGIYLGGQPAAAAQVLEGKCTTNEFRFFSGSVNWKPGQLQHEISSKLWTIASTSRSVALKHCFQLPVPLWIEVNKLLGVDVQSSEF